MEIRNKLTLQFLLIVAGIMLVALWYIHFQFKNHLQDEFYNTLRSKALMTAEMVLGKIGRSAQDLQVQPDTTDSGITTYSENITIYNAENRKVFSFYPGNRKISESVLRSIRKKNEYKFEDGQFCYYGLVYNQSSGDSFVVVAESVFNPEHLVNLSQILIWVYIIFIALVAFGGWIFSGQALAPIRQIMNQVDVILPSDMSQRLQPPNQKDELSRLVITFNKLLDRIENAFVNQKLFLSNISHELKNPLNVINTQLQISLAKDRSKEEYEKTLKSVLDDVRELSDSSEKLMQLAKINSDGSEISINKVRIDELIWQTKTAILKTHPEYNITLEITSLPDMEEKLIVKGNEQLLKTALYNLMENGCKFSPEKHVKVKLSFLENSSMAIEIQDHGPGVNEAEIPMLFEPFYRSSKTNSVKGSGIGLSLVDSIMKLHKVNLEVASLQGLGTTFKLEFPVAG